jgi:hypothetical protein
MPSGSDRKFELMFDSRKEIGDRVIDAIDLAIDFATLGEYGLEEVDRRPLACEARHRGGRTRSTGAWNAAVARFATQS